MYCKYGFRRDSSGKKHLGLLIIALIGLISISCGKKVPNSSEDVLIIGSREYQRIATQGVDYTKQHIYQHKNLTVHVTQIPKPEPDGWILYGTEILKSQGQLYVEDYKSRFDNVYVESEKDDYFDLEGKVLSSHEIVTRFDTVDTKMRVLILLIKLPNNDDFVSVIHEAEMDSFNKAQIWEFVMIWLAERADSEYKHMFSPLDSIPIVQIETDKDLFPEEERNLLRSNLPEYAQGVVAEFEWHPNGNTQTFNLSGLFVDDLSDAIYKHEQSHAFFPSEEGIDAKLMSIAEDFGLNLTANHYKNWGKAELVADLNTLLILSAEGQTVTLKKYILLRDIPDDLFMPFLTLSEVCEKNLTASANDSTVEPCHTLAQKFVTPLDPMIVEHGVLTTTVIIIDQ